MHLFPLVFSINYFCVFYIIIFIDRIKYIPLKGTPPRSGRVNHEKRFFFSKTYIFLLSTYRVYHNLLYGTVMSSIDLATQF